ncbi:MAG: hypothetical protein H6Q73_3184 [Firmicutes bacterium]|nr:hypothetical protein [Bacillota bacterium]
MDKNSFSFQMGLTGRERKEIAKLIASYFETQPVYQGAPSFEYGIIEHSGREWRIDRNCTLMTNGTKEEDVNTVFAILKVLGENGINADGKVAITISAAEHTGVTLRNLVNLLASKERLIAKAMNSEQTFIAPKMIETVNSANLKTIDDFIEAVGDEYGSGIAVNSDSITLRWFSATLEPEVLQAYFQFTFKVNEMALAQKHSTSREKKTSNDKYAFRVWLLRLGFIGDKYKTSRKILLEKLEGNAAYAKPSKMLLGDGDMLPR